LFWFICRFRLAASLFIDCNWRTCDMSTRCSLRSWNP